MYPSKLIKNLSKTTGFDASAIEYLLTIGLTKQQIVKLSEVIQADSTTTLQELLMLIRRHLYE